MMDTAVDQLVAMFKSKASDLVVIFPVRVAPVPAEFSVECFKPSLHQVLADGQKVEHGLRLG